MLYSVRYKCRFVVIWSVLLLLQQFQLVLLLNINIIGKNKKVLDNRRFSTNARKNTKTLKSSSALNKRLKFISRVGPTFTDSSKNLHENIKVPLKKIYNSKVKPNLHLMKLAKPANKVMRCRRMIKVVCSVPNPNQNLIKKAFDYNGTTDLPNKWKVQFDELLSGINMTKPGQRAVVGVRQSDKFVYNMSSDINDMRNVTKRPIPKENFDVDPNNDSTNVMHTEQDLLSTIEDSLNICTKAKPCEVFLYTKLSPCTQHPQAYAESCLNYTVSTCKKWFLKSGTRCHVAFGKFFNNNKEAFNSTWDDYLGSFMGNRKFEKDKLLSDLAKQGFSKETIRKTDEFLKDNVELIRENLVDRMKKEGYEKLQKNIKFNFSDAYNNALEYLKDEKPNMTDLVDKFKEELSTIITAVKDVGKRFENLIDNWNSKYSNEKLTVKEIRKNLIEMATETYDKLEENVKVILSEGFNNTLKYLQNTKPSMKGLVEKFKKELPKVYKTVEELVTGFEKLIDYWNALYSRVTLNKFAAKQNVMSDITEVTDGIEREVIDFSFYDLN